jgi:4-amino-4-deoxy-L-arabinose transferase-like glycosyltransferase
MEMKRAADILPFSGQKTRSADEMTDAALSLLPSATRSKRSFAAIELLLILLAGLFVYCWKLGDSPLDRTEPHRALVAHQMATGGDWLIPHLFGEVYLRKPPLIYWLQAATEKVVGHGNEFVWRLPSAVGSALLAVVLAWWASRWFGPFARLPAGFACLALIALWEQDRGADIDALNTVASVIAAMVILEILFGDRATPIAPGESRTVPVRSSFHVGWTFALAVFTWATLMLKGPGGFPPVLGAILGPAIVLRTWHRLRRPSLWLGLLLGIAGFVTYGVLVKLEIHRRGLVTDKAGLKEAMQRMLLHDVHQLWPASTAFVTALLFAIPVSLAIPFALGLVRRDSKADPRRQRVLAIVSTIAAALVIWFIAGNGNPRYEYVALPLLAPLVGAVAVGWREGKFSSASIGGMRAILIGVCGLWIGVQLILTAALWHRSADHVSIVVAAALSVILGITAAVMWIRSRYRLAAPLLAVVILLLAVPLSDRKNIERRRKSAQSTAQQLRGIVGDGTSVGVGSMVRDMPELFYYAGVQVHAYGEFGLPALAADPSGRWVVLSQNPMFPELSTLQEQVPNAFPRGVTKLNMPDPRDKVYVGWYDPPAGASREVHYTSNPAGETVGGSDE